MKRKVAWILLLSVLCCCTSGLAQVPSPKQVGYPGALFARFGEDIAKQMLGLTGAEPAQSTGQTGVTIRIIGDSDIPLIGPSTVAGAQSPEVVETQEVEETPVDPVPQDDYVEQFTLEEAQYLIDAHLHNQWETSIYGSFTETYKQAFGIDLADDLMLHVEDGRIDRPALDALIEKIDLLLLNPNYSVD